MLAFPSRRENRDWATVVCGMALYRLEHGLVRESVAIIRPVANQKAREFWFLFTGADFSDPQK
jgi:hypothetical protein